MKSPAPNNFQRFATQYPDYVHDLDRIMKLISNIADLELRSQVQSRVNLELGIVLLKNHEVDEALKKILSMEIVNLKDSK